MFGPVVEVVERALVAFDPLSVPLVSAESTWLELDRIERLVAGAKVRLAGRVEEAGGWRRAGRRSAADHLAVLSGSTVGTALGVLVTSKRLETLPVVVEALACGRLSATQVQSVADAATAAPHEQASLVGAAARESVSELRERCGRVKAAADKDSEATYRRLHAARALRHRACPDGAAELTYRSTPDEVADVVSVVRAFADRLFKAAHKAGCPESSEAHMADGLLAAVRQGGVLRASIEPGTTDQAEAENEAEAGEAGAGSTQLALAERDPGLEPPTLEVQALESEVLGRWALESETHEPETLELETLEPGAVEGSEVVAGEEDVDPLVGVIPKAIVIRIDWDAWVRGWPVGGEVCEIPGLGSVPVSLVKAMVESGDAVLKAVVTRGVNVATVAHVGRKPTVAQSTALQWQDLVCVEPGCGQRAYLEIDHTVPFTMNRITALELLRPRCKHHHRIKTRQDLIDIAAQRNRDGPSGDPDDGPRGPWSGAGPTKPGAGPPSP